MKTTILTLVALIFCVRGIAQENNFNDPFIQALTFYFNPVAFADTKNNLIMDSYGVDKSGKPIIDTVFVQKENYLPEVLPVKIKHHVIKYVYKEEINDVKGKYISLVTLSPMRKSNGVYSMKMTNYRKTRDNWSSWGYHEFKFTYDAKTGEYRLSLPIITMCNYL